MKKLLLFLIIPFLTFGQNADLKDTSIDKKRTFSIDIPFNQGVSFFGNSFKTNMDFGLAFLLEGGGFLDSWKEEFSDLETIGVAVSINMLFDSNSHQEFRVHGDASFLSFKLVWESDDRWGAIDFSFLINDDINMFYDDAFRLSLTHQIADFLYVTGGWYLDRDKKGHKNTRHDLPIFGLGVAF